jgi:YfiH family protein
VRIGLVADASSDWLRPDIGARGIQVISTTRAGGASTGSFAGFNVGGHVGDSDEVVQANRQMLYGQLPSGSTITWLNQVHGTHVIHAPSEYSKGVEADAVWSDEPGFACAVMTADCLPIILADIEGRCVAAAHCGWRGLAGGILKRTIEAMPVDPSRLVAWLGPAIGPSAFEVGGDVLAAFYLAEEDLAVHPIPETDNKYFLDLNILAGRQLLTLGLDPGQVSGGDTCTYSNPQRFYSYRRDGETGRMVTLILKK